MEPNTCAESERLGGEAAKMEHVHVQGQGMALGRPWSRWWGLQQRCSAAARATGPTGAPRGRAESGARRGGFVHTIPFAEVVSLLDPNMKSTKARKYQILYDEVKRRLDPPEKMSLRSLAAYTRVSRGPASKRTLLESLQSIGLAPSANTAVSSSFSKLTEGDTAALCRDMREFASQYMNYDTMVKTLLPETNHVQHWSKIIETRNHLEDMRRCFHDPENSRTFDSVTHGFGTAMLDVAFDMIERVIDKQIRVLSGNPEPEEPQQEKRGRKRKAGPAGRRGGAQGQAQDSQDPAGQGRGQGQGRQETDVTCMTNLPAEASASYSVQSARRAESGARRGGFVHTIPFAEVVSLLDPNMKSTKARKYQILYDEVKRRLDPPEKMSLRSLAAYTRVSRGPASKRTLLESLQSIGLAPSANTAVSSSFSKLTEGDTAALCRDMREFCLPVHELRPDGENAAP
ncbi:hypothetical protein ANANG_G00046790 [Anguilla anguilla]|uniref:Transcription factor AP-2 C-terminal domain-containing protein n=1 Tax=Anguilla anguilla TaxID=7936 RepID=A0A9D3S845_ANGAN|nr:hypothetical protein ANANG_G00046790 [Anguilla anguilla]